MTFAHGVGKVTLRIDLYHFPKIPLDAMPTALVVRLAVAGGLLHVHGVSVARRGRQMECWHRARPADMTTFRTRDTSPVMPTGGWVAPAAPLRQSPASEGRPPASCRWTASRDVSREIGRAHV